jgi:hypothetical protein
MTIIPDLLKVYDTSVSERNQFLILLIILLIGIAILYYFRDAFNRNKGKYQLLSQLSEQNCQIGLSPELKHHFSVIMVEYRKGLEHYMNQIRNSGGNPDDYRNLSCQMDEANDYIDRFKIWLDKQPCHPNLPSRFEARKIIGVIVRMLEVVFHPKQMTIQNHIDNDIYVYGSQAYFCIAFEIVLFRAMQDSEPHSAVILSASDDREHVTFTVASPQLALSDEIQTVLRLLIRKLETNPKAAVLLQTRAEICLKCVYENCGKYWFESDPEKGMVSNFTVPVLPNL